MGLFSSKKKVYTSTSVYNLAGDIKDRPNVLKTTILAQAINNTFSGYGDAIGHSYLFGQGMKMRQFAKWVDKSGYRSATGASSPRVRFDSITTNQIDALENEIGYILNTPVYIINVDFGYGELEWWGDQYVSINRPDLIGKNYIVDLVEGEATGTLYVYGDDDVNFEIPIEIISIPLVGYVAENYYMYVSYITETGRTVGPETVYPLVQVPNLSPVTDYTLINTLEDPVELNLRVYKKTFVTYSDGSDSEESTTEISNTTYTEPNTDQQYERRLPVPADDGQLKESIENLSQFTRRIISYTNEVTLFTEEENEDGVTVTTTEITYTPNIEEKYSEQKKERIDVVNEWTLPSLFYYAKDSGNTQLDTYFSTSTTTGTYYPIIPVKYGPFISNSFNKRVYELNIEGYRKLTGKRKAYKDMLTGIQSNRDIGQVNHIYVMFGASINSRDESAKRYIYDYFDNFYSTNSGSTNNINSYIQEVNLARESVLLWEAWFEGQKDINNPYYGKPEPQTKSYPTLPSYSFSLRNNFNFVYTIKWGGVRATDGFGLYKPSAKVGQVFVERGDVITIEVPKKAWSDRKSISNVIRRQPIIIKELDITLQISKSNWRKLTVLDLTSFNHVHKGKGESLAAYDEMGTSDESGLIIPLNEAAFKDMGLIKGTQFTGANAYLILNSYQVVKKKWYQSGAFKIILVIAIIIISVVFTPAAGAGVSGVLGSAGAAGTAIGFASGSVAAIVAGSIANIVAAIVVTKVITTVAVSIFGEKVGLIIGTVLSIAALNVGTSLANGQGWASNFSEMMNPVNILKLTDSVSQTFINDINTKTKELTHETEALVTEYEKEAKRIEDLYELNFGVGNGIDIKAITELASKFEYRKEDVGAFLSRTLMTGSDIAQLSQDMIDKFASMTTALILE